MLSTPIYVSTVAEEDIPTIQEGIGKRNNADDINDTIRARRGIPLSFILVSNLGK
ncbi:MAG: hypothetical protein RRE78_09530 [Acidianus sp.]|jgi:hypothetical protein|nr:hypothetical protein [Acidianus sp.]